MAELATGHNLPLGIFCLVLTLCAVLSPIWDSRSPILTSYLNVIPTRIDMLRIMAQSILCLVVSLSPSYSIDLEHMHYGSHFSNRYSLLNLYYFYSLSTPATNSIAIEICNEMGQQRVTRECNGKEKTNEKCQRKQAREKTHPL